LLLFIVGLSIFFYAIQAAFGIDKKLITNIKTVIIYSSYVILMFMAIYSITGYRYSRTNWRGVRGKLTGSAKHFAFLSIYRTFLNIVTLGYLIPHSQIKTMGYMTNNSYFGNAKAEFKGTFQPLIKTNIITLLLIPVTFGFSRFWYQASFIKHLLSNTHIASNTLISNYTGKKLLSLVLVNILILIFTLGLGLPIIIWRNLRFISQNIAIAGEIDSSKIMQSAQKDNAIGEGFDQALDMDTGLV
jgi:uncharacterized membrane protein YjgN (DUF898 family)